METSTGNGTSLANELSDRPTLKAVIIYEDFATGMRAKCFYEDLVYELKGKYDLNLDLWSFQVSQSQKLGIQPRKSQPGLTLFFFRYAATLGFLLRLGSGLKLGPG